MKKSVIVQARMTSSRLPGKILKPVLGKPLIEYQVERLKRAVHCDGIIIATTANSADDPVIELCERLGIHAHRGPEQDVLMRYHGAATAYGTDVIVRITSDCPLIDPHVIDRVIGFYLDNESSYDYVSNTLVRSYPQGMDTEVFSYRALDEACREAAEQPEREHVTPFIYRHPERYRLGNVLNGEDQSRHRWTVDTPEDFELIRRIIEALYPGNKLFTQADVLRVLEQNPAWFNINAHIQQKKLGE